jgi:hypothetical protein
VMAATDDVHAGELPPSVALPDLPENAFEIARLWVNNERSFVAVGMPQNWQPELLGSLLVESLHTAAEAYAAQTDLSEEETLSRMRGVDEEGERLSA